MVSTTSGQVLQMDNQRRSLLTREPPIKDTMAFYQLALMSLRFCVLWSLNSKVLLTCTYVPSSSNGRCDDA